MAFAWSINPYKGCVHGCHYCFARRYHSFIDLDVGDDFTGIILVRVNAPEVLRRELAKRSWKREMVALGTATDPYQPIEGKYRLTRGILEALRDFRTPVSIITKGSMVVRDIDVLADLQQRAGCTVSFSTTTLDEDTWRRLEPGTPPPLQRLRAMQRLAEAGVNAGVISTTSRPSFARRRSIAPASSTLCRCGCKRESKNTSWDSSTGSTPTCCPDISRFMRASIRRGDTIAGSSTPSASTESGLAYDSGQCYGGNI
jgi:hypothetical protein